jgi:hypothetical protein
MDRLPFVAVVLKAVIFLFVQRLRPCWCREAAQKNGYDEQKKTAKNWSGKHWRTGRMMTEVIVYKNGKRRSFILSYNSIFLPYEASCACP